ncbi:MAG TPA: RNA polymerase sigma factor [Ktedonobacteraceae bacterium]|nr:RNA polymerase sigma factor [Ktedonobacteraceae bacterium]
MTTVTTAEPGAGISQPLESEFAQSPDERQKKIESDRSSEQRILAIRAREADEAAFADILDTYQGLLLRTAYSIVKDRDIAEDAVQNALIQAWRHLPSLREPGALRSWLMRIIVNQCISFKRGLARSTRFLQEAFAEQEMEQASQVADYAEGRLERDWDLARAIEELPVKQRLAIALHYYQGMTLPEMSHALQTSENTLKKRLQAAISNLRRVVKTEDVIYPPDHL